MDTLREKALARVRTERRRLEKNFAWLPADAMQEQGVVNDWSVKDVLAHLAEWEVLCMGWITASRGGETPACPAPGYTWGTIDALNAQIYARFRACSLDEVLAMFRDVHQQFEALIGTLNEEELGVPGYFPWTGSKTLFDWINFYGAHDAWAKKKIRRYIQNSEEFGGYGESFED